ncbi:glycosyltransferase family 2 protein [Micrococcus flavus]|uniref:N-acetylglucosaminyl-diphospho-decaprenol L-rhamnosyltransferase n=2 Tax=Micrococcus flavus TaxID=384602 RepID=A0A4Y8X2T8_9MICC|nr:glycosyltransferase family 2 protein [Micrococcus flavus]MBB4883296.1 N-acetylglucosaminyl-diphospho-decaprenol L-rhamnosyltransferase [Micrococcus flavus]TFI03706.1 glycosyltransferase family 2 protein [Micrococcus flavus]GGK43954.1 dTDP-Rha--alpha-D-GlcNAc-pyrophosphate polyprenol alpha-3-L-rhamnosyltransferase [Micrococcus flavus]
MSAPHSAAPVTVVIPHYGDPDPTRALVEALLAAPGRSVAAVVVSDDASPEPYPLPAPGEDALRVVRRERNGGFGANVNTGLAEVTTELALVLNSDAEITGEQIDALVAAAAPYQPAVVSPQVVNDDGTPQWSGRHFPTVGHQVVEWLTPLARFRHLPALHEAVGHDVAAARAQAPTPVDWVMGAVLLLPMAQVRAVGGFDEDYFMNSEEVDLQRRLRDAGVPSIVVPSVRVVHGLHGSSDPLRRRSWLVDSRFRYARTFGHPRTLKAALTAATGVNFAVNRIRQARGTDVDAAAVFRAERDLIWKGTHR